MTLSVISFSPNTIIKSTDTNSNYQAILQGVLILDGSGNPLTGLTQIKNGAGFKGFSNASDRIGIGVYGSPHVEMISGANYSRISGGVAGACEWNVYNDGTSDRFLVTATAPGAYQLLVSASGIRGRKSTNATCTSTLAFLGRITECIEQGIEHIVGGIGGLNSAMQG
nr:hypothetical protein [Ktedonobacterales bacterium]